MIFNFMFSLFSSLRVKPCMSESKYYADDTHMHRIEIDVNHQNFQCTGRIRLSFDHAQNRNCLRKPQEFSIPVDLNLLAALKEKAGDNIRTKLTISKDVYGDQFDIDYSNRTPNGYIFSGKELEKSTQIFHAAPLLNSVTGQSHMELLPEDHDALRYLNAMESQLIQPLADGGVKNEEAVAPPLYNLSTGSPADNITRAAVNYINQNLLERFR